MSSFNKYIEMAQQYLENIVDTLSPEELRDKIITDIDRFDKINIIKNNNADIEPEQLKAMGDEALTDNIIQMLNENPRKDTIKLGINNLLQWKNKSGEKTVSQNDLGDEPEQNFGDDDRPRYGVDDYKDTDATFQKNASAWNKYESKARELGSGRRYA